jgi:hypothetical protein
MLFDWPTPEQITYRLWRLRRLWAVCTLVPVCAILFFGLPLMQGVLVAGLVTVHLALFPNVAQETLGLSVAATGLVVTAPVVRDLALLAPDPHVQATLVLAAALAVIVAGAVMMLFARLLSLLIYAGPVMRRRLVSRVDLACSTAVAHRHFALQPQIRRGRILTGQADGQGVFEVAVASAQLADPLHPDLPLVVRVAAKVLQSDAGSHDLLLMLADGGVTVCAHRFEASAAGCRVTLSELPGDFTLGMHLLYWLTDQQADAMTEVADVIAGQPERANGLAHGVSFLSLAGLVLSPSEPLADRAK